MGIDAEDTFVDCGILPSLLNCHCNIIYFETRSVSLDLAIKESNFNFNAYPKRSVLKDSIEIFKSKLTGPDAAEQHKRLDCKYQCMKQFLRIIAPNDEDVKSKNLLTVFGVSFPSSTNTEPSILSPFTLREINPPKFLEPPSMSLFLLYRPGHFDVVYPRVEDNSPDAEPMGLRTPKDAKTLRISKKKK